MLNLEAATPRFSTQGQRQSPEPETYARLRDDLLEARRPSPEEERPGRSLRTMFGIAAVKLASILLLEHQHALLVLLNQASINMPAGC